MSDYNDSYEPSRETHNGLAGSIAIAAFVGSILFLLSCWIRLKLPRYFMPKAYHKEGIRHPPEKKHASGFFNWIPYTIKFSEDNLGDEYGGLDIVNYLTFLRYSIVFFAVLSAFGIIDLIVNLTGDGGVGGDNKTSMANIEQKSSRFYLHAILTAIFAAATCYLIFRVQRKTCESRTKHIKKDAPYTRSVLITHIPTKLATKEALTEAFGYLYGPENITGVSIVQETDEAEKVRQERLEIVPKYKTAYFRKAGGAEQEFVRDGKLCFGNKVEAVSHWEKQLKMKDEELVAAQSKPAKLTSSAFITFTTISAALQCTQTRLHYDYDNMKTYFGPDPNEVCWENLGKSKMELFVRFLISTIILILLFLFWMIPVAFLAAFTNLESLSSVSGFGWLDFVLDIPGFPRGILVGFLPSLVLIIFMALLPTIIRAILKIRCYVLTSDLERDVGFDYWFFLLLYVFLVITIAGSATRSLNRYINDPSGIPADLAESLPSQALFYFNYTAVAAFIAKGVFLLQVPGFLIAMFKTKRAKSDYERANANPTRPLPFFKAYSTDLIIFTVGLVYSVMAPLVCMMALIYFVIAWFTAKYYLVFMHKPAYNSINMNQVAMKANFISLYIFLLLMIGLFSINVAPGGFITLVALILVILFTVWAFRQFSGLQRFSPLLDFAQKHELVPAHENYYLPPALVPPPMIEELTRTQDDLESGVHVREQAAMGDTATRIAADPKLGDIDIAHTA